MYEEKHGLQVDKNLAHFLVHDVLPGLNIDEDKLWQNFSNLAETLAIENKNLLDEREELQSKIDAWHKAHPGPIADMGAYKSFLTDIGYLVPTPQTCQVETQNVDPEIASIAGPQLVVPVNNARFSLNAVNARWGSLYDALYGSDIFPGLENAEKPYDAARGNQVISYAFDFLDKAIPLSEGSHHDVKSYALEKTEDGYSCRIMMQDGSATTLRDPDVFAGFQGEEHNPHLYLFSHHGLHIELHIDAKHQIGQAAPGFVKDIILESALTTIQDCEDSVAAVNAEDKIHVYRNWLGLMKGDLATNFSKNGIDTIRAMNGDRHYTDAEARPLTLSGRSLLLVRNVGHLMTNPAICLKDGSEIPEGIMDALFTSLCAMHDLKKSDGNSRCGSIYIVKPKMHGPKEVAFTNKLFAGIEDILGLERYTLKVGVMDEERRTTVNLAACIDAVKNRIVFINTGFLDRTGDEIHTSMEAGPVLPKEEIKTQQWIAAYENWNVDTGLNCGLKGKAQIGKGMWPKPDEMKEMMLTKQAHPEAGANCAWVPSPTAATLHAIHYHYVNVADVQDRISQRETARLDDILTPPIMQDHTLTEDDITRELENNAQGILGYVVRWVDQGIGCSKVPDINNIGLMEDRATLRISAQHMANWLHHGLCTKEQVLDVMKRMAVVVDEQNTNDPHYQPMSPDYLGIAFTSACALVLEGRIQPSGYTEPLLHTFRLEKYKTEKIHAVG